MQGGCGRAADWNPEVGQGAEQEGGAQVRMGEAAKTEEGVRECSGREGGRGEEGTEGCGVTHLSHFGWAWVGGWAVAGTGLWEQLKSCILMNSSPPTI